MTPVFICGYPKSGTTLLSSLLDGHSQVAVVPEETFLLAQAAMADHSPNSLLDWLLEDSMAQANLRQGTANGRRNFDYRKLDYDAVAADTRRIFSKSEGERSDVLASFGAAFCGHSSQTDKRYLCEKSPGNELHVDQILADYPDARLVYMNRDPRDVFNSYRVKRRRYPTSVDDLPIPEFVEKYALSQWSIRRASTNSDLVMMIDYEALVTNPKAVMTDLAAFLNIDFEESMLAPTRFGEAWSGNSMADTEFTGVSSSSVGRWQKELAPADADVIGAILGVSTSTDVPISRSVAGLFNVARAVLSLGARRPRVTRNLIRLRMAGG